MQHEQAFTALFEAQHPRVLAYALRRLGNAADAEDCAAEVFRLGWEQPEIPSVGWLFVTAKNLVYARRRADLRLVELSRRVATEAARLAPDTPPDQEICQALDRLGAAERELLMAFYWDDLSGAECAQLLGCSTAAIWVRLHRARQALKAQLAPGRTAPSATTEPHPRHILPEPVVQGELS